MSEPIQLPVDEAQFQRPEVVCDTVDSSGFGGIPDMWTYCPQVGRADVIRDGVKGYDAD